jgi:3-oxoacyl-[acyl-carrier protein] reductase
MKNILVTGVSRGVGLTTSELLLKNGNQVYGISRSHNDSVKHLEKLYPHSFHFKSYDLNNSDAVQSEIFKSFIPNSVPLHGFVNNAAIAYDDIVTNLNVKSLQEMYAVNVFTPFNIVKYAIRNMIFNRVKGSIVHISSISVHTGYKGLAMYASSKGALEAFSKNTAREWGERGIRSNCIVAGFMETDMSAKLSHFS